MKKKPTTPNSPKSKVQLKNLKIHKDTTGTISEADAGKIKGGSKGTYGATYCWVARAVYGEDNPRWLLFREWLLTEAPTWFRNLYIRQGERFARWLVPHELLKSLIRLWMDSKIDRKHLAASSTV